MNGFELIITVINARGRESERITIPCHTFNEGVVIARAQRAEYQARGCDILWTCQETPVCNLSDTESPEGVWQS